MSLHESLLPQEPEQTYTENDLQIVEEVVGKETANSLRKLADIGKNSQYQQLVENVLASICTGGLSLSYLKVEDIRLLVSQNFFEGEAKEKIDEFLVEFDKACSAMYEYKSIEIQDHHNRVELLKDASDRFLDGKKGLWPIIYEMEWTYNLASIDDLEEEQIGYLREIFDFYEYLINDEYYNSTEVTVSKIDARQLFYAIKRLLPPQPPLFQMLSVQHFSKFYDKPMADLISKPFFTYLVNQFDHNYAEDFFRTNSSDDDGKEGLFISEQKDLQYLHKFELSYEEYFVIIMDLVDSIKKRFAENNFKQKIKFESASLINGVAAHPGSLTNRFSGGEFSHMKLAEDQEASVAEIGIYVYDDNGKKIDEIIVSGAWEFLFAESLLQSPQSMYSLSPRRVIPFLLKHRGKLKKIVSPELYDLLGGSKIHPFLQKWLDQI